jgi:PAS domain S-box-containing protein
VYRDGRIIYVNPVIAATLGHPSPEELLGRPILDFVHPDDARLVARRFPKPRPAGTPARVQEIRFLRRDGRAVVADVSPIGIEFDGAPAIAIWPAT